MIKDIVPVLNRMLRDDVSIEEYSDDAFVYRLFYEIYQQVPYVSYFFSGIDEDDVEDLGEFELKDTEDKIIETTKCTVYQWKNNRILLGDNWIEFKGVIFSLDEQFPDVLSQCIVTSKKDSANLIFVSVSSRGGFVKKLLPVNEVDIDYDINYNEDFPYERIEELLTKGNSELLLFWGIPGSGN